MYLSRIRVPANTWSITATIDGVTDTVYIAAGNYYLDGTSAESLCQAVDDALESGWAAENFTVGHSTTTGMISIACTTLAGTWAVAFDQLAFANAMGYAMAGGGWAATATTPQVSDVLPTLQLFAGSGRSAYPGLLYRTSGATVIAESGVTAHVGSGIARQFSSWEHGFEAYTGASSPLESGVWAADAGALWTWADFWLHHVSTGQPFRYFSSTGLAATAYDDEFVFDGKMYQEFSPQRVEEGSDRYWKVGFDVAIYQEAT